METFDGQLIIAVNVFKGMNLSNNYDMDRICDRLRYELRKKRISNEKAARELGVSRDLIFDYINPNYSESSMQVETLIKFADYFGKEKYYFCNDYHIFLDTVDAGSFLRKAKLEYNMTREEFAQYLDISYTRYRSYEDGRCKIPREVFDKLKNKIMTIS